MLLVIDVGNTSITFGLYKGKKLFKTWRGATKKDGSSAYFIKFLPMFRLKGICIASVVPEIDQKLSAAVKERYGIAPLFVTHRNAGMEITYKKPIEIGADRLVDAVAAWKKYKRACIVVDIGTATTVEYIDGLGRYCGGPITFGLATATEALYQAASKLPRVKIVPIRKMIPSSTRAAIMAGVYVGYLGLVERLVLEMKKEVGGDPVVILTGGFAQLVARGLHIKIHLEPHLTLNGLRLIYQSVIRGR